MSYYKIPWLEGQNYSRRFKIRRMTKRGFKLNFKIHKGSLPQETFITEGLTFCFSVLLSFVPVGFWNTTTSTLKEIIPFSQMKSNNLKSFHLCGWRIFFQLSGGYVSRFLLIKAFNISGKEILKAIYVVFSIYSILVFTVFIV